MKINGLMSGSVALLALSLCAQAFADCESPTEGLDPSPNAYACYINCVESNTAECELEELQKKCQVSCKDQFTEPVSLSPVKPSKLPQFNDEY